MTRRPTKAASPSSRPGPSGRARRVVFGLGSNLGDRRAYLEEAAAMLEASEGVSAGSRAGVYETPPAGGPPQGDYLNSALLLVSDLPARALLALALDVERRLGRDRSSGERWGPRTIDVDLLWLEGEVVAEPDLLVPHPRLAERPFALAPLVDLAPDARDPATGNLYADLLAAMPPIRRVG